MATVKGHQLLVASLQRAGVDTLFFLSGGPMMDVQRGVIHAGIRCVDVRHEQAAAMMAHAWSRLTHRVGVCMAASGPGTLNLVTGVANAHINAVPLVVLGGSSPVANYGQGDFQEVDQLRLMAPITKAAIRVYRTERIPEQVQHAFLVAQSGQPGPVYLDMPGDVLYREVEESQVSWPPFDLTVPRNPADPDLVKAAANMLRSAQRPVIISGSGALLASAEADLARLAERMAVPVYTTPQGRGIIPEDNPLTPISARSLAFREADLVLVVGTRLNYVIGYGRPPRFAEGVRMIQIDTDASELARQAHVSVRLQGDAGRVLKQLEGELAGDFLPLAAHREWLDRLQVKHEAGEAKSRAALAAMDQTPIHPLRLCAEVAGVLDRDAILVVDGSEILNFARQTIPTYVPGHRMNTGPFGCLGVGVPYGLAAKVACPDQPVLVLTGDGAFGLNGMEFDTAAGHNLPVVVVISNNGGWASDSGTKPWRRLGHVRYDTMFKDWGVHGEFVTEPSQIRPALLRALASGRPACVNVVTDPKAHATTAAFASYEYA